MAKWSGAEAMIVLIFDRVEWDRCEAAGSVGDRHAMRFAPCKLFR